jgi:hypothetical protein
MGACLLGQLPAIAGATLLSLGNSAPDMLSALASFAAGGGGAAAVGLNGVLGGALFVSAAVSALSPCTSLATGSPSTLPASSMTQASSSWLSQLWPSSLPLFLPPWLTIPNASKERWSKPTAVTAATLAPIFLSILWSHDHARPNLHVLLGGGGIALGLLAFLTTNATGRRR